MSLLLFNIYSKYIFREALEMEVNGQWINNIRSADDMVIFANSLESLQCFMSRVTLQQDHKHTLDFNVIKTKFMVISILRCHLAIDQKPVASVHKYTYLYSLYHRKQPTGQR